MLKITITFTSKTFKAPLKTSTATLGLRGNRTSGIREPNLTSTIQFLKLLFHCVEDIFTQNSSADAMVCYCNTVLLKNAYIAFVFRILYSIFFFLKHYRLKPRESIYSAYCLTMSIDSQKFYLFYPNV